MSGQDFLRLVNEAFASFLKELGFNMEEPSISGRLYRVNFRGELHVVTISYEPGDDALFIYVFGREGGRLSDIDDRSRTPRLADLNGRYMQSVTDAERAANETAFKAILAKDKAEKLLLKSAKELRLVLPKYLLSSAPKEGWST